MALENAKIVDVALAAVVDLAPGAGPTLLITRRTGRQVYAGYWELPGGKCEPGETPDQAAVRELREEVGLTVRPAQPMQTIEHAYDHAHVRLHPWLCYAEAADAARPIEVAELRWVGPGELESYTFPEANDPLIAQLRDWLHQPATLPPR
jgi:8-oxo-dGTP diphosphatase